MAYEMMLRYGIMEKISDNAYQPTVQFMWQWMRRATGERNQYISLCRAFLDRCPAGLSDVTLSVMATVFFQHISRSPEGQATAEG